MANSETLLRMCDSCGGVDDHPRHVYGTVDGDANTSPETAAKALENGGPDAVDGILRHVADRTTVMKHLDCCAADGCPDTDGETRSCEEIHKTTSGADVAHGTAFGKGDGVVRGSALTKHVLDNGEKVGKIGRRLNAKRALNELVARGDKGEKIEGLDEKLAAIEEELEAAK